MTVHSIRKTLASIVSENLDSKAASDVLGHADSRLTERVYIAKTDKDVPIGDVVNQALKEARKVSKKSPNKEAKEEE
ncbi:integrase [Corynebacterium glutamicum]|nr:integrase [Corynebacterium glutamicum]